MYPGQPGPESVPCLLLKITLSNRYVFVNDVTGAWQRRECLLTLATDRFVTNKQTTNNSFFFSSRLHHKYFRSFILFITLSVWRRHSIHALKVKEQLRHEALLLTKCVVANVPVKPDSKKHV